MSEPLTHRRYIFIGIMMAAIGVAPAIAKEPSALFGSGSLKCKVFVSANRDKMMDELADEMFAWVQGWFSAKNVSGRLAAPLTVGGGLSADALKAMLVSQCEDRPDAELWEAADILYQSLAEKHL